MTADILTKSLPRVKVEKTSLCITRKLKHENRLIDTTEAVSVKAVYSFQVKKKVFFSNFLNEKALTSK